MRKVLCAIATSICCIANPALADDETDWSGAYIGIHAGYTSLKSDSTPVLSGTWTSESAALQSEVVAGWSAKQSLENANFGAQLGYNYDAGGVVLGLEGDFTLVNGSDVFRRGPIATVVTPALSYTYGNTIDPKYSASVRAKIGVPLGQTLVYAHGGWALTRAEIGADILSNGGYSKAVLQNETFNGYIVGGGLEQKLGTNASVRLEYSYTDQGDKSYVTIYQPGSTFAPPAFNYTETFTQDLRMHLVKVGLNYHF